MTAIARLGKVLLDFFNDNISLSDCPVGLVVASTTAERGVLGSILRSGKKCYWGFLIIISQ